MALKKRGKERALQTITDAGDKAGDEAEVLVAGPGADPAAKHAPHPEEMKGSVELRITNHVTLKATVRTTPAGLVGAAALLAAILVPIMWNRRPPVI